MELNHHSAAVLPYYFNNSGMLSFFLERKSADLRPPYFNNGLNFFGGNGVKDDLSPFNLAKREVGEEFHRLDERPESLNEIVGQEFSRESQEKQRELVDKLKTWYSLEKIGEIRILVPLLLEGAEFASHYVVMVNPPIMKTPLTYASTIFTKELSRDEAERIQDLVGKYNGRLTTDNVLRGSRSEFITLDQINTRGDKFAWGYCQKLDHLLREGYLPQKNSVGVIRPLRRDLIEVTTLPKDKNLNFSSFEEFVSLTGHTYKP